MSIPRIRDIWNWHNDDLKQNGWFSNFQIVLEGFCLSAWKYWHNWKYLNSTIIYTNFSKHITNIMFICAPIWCKISFAFASENEKYGKFDFSQGVTISRTSNLINKSVNISNFYHIMFKKIVLSEYTNKIITSVLEVC